MTGENCQHAQAYRCYRQGNHPRSQEERKAPPLENKSSAGEREEGRQDGGAQKSARRCWSLERAVRSSKSPSKHSKTTGLLAGMVLAVFFHTRSDASGSWIGTAFLHDPLQLGLNSPEMLAYERRGSGLWKMSNLILTTSSDSRRLIRLASGSKGRRLEVSGPGGLRTRWVELSGQLRFLGSFFK